MVSITWSWIQVLKMLVFLDSSAREIEQLGYLMIIYRGHFSNFCILTQPCCVGILCNTRFSMAIVALFPSVPVQQLLFYGKLNKKENWTRNNIQNNYRKIPTECIISFHLGFLLTIMHKPSVEILNFGPRKNCVNV